MQKTKYENRLMMMHAFRRDFPKRKSLISIRWCNLKTFFLLGCILILAGCAQTADKRETPVPEQVVGDVLTFTEQWPDDDQYVVRMYVTENFIRMDQSPNRGEYQIFDRRKKQLLIINDRQQQYRIIRATQTIPKVPRQWQKKMSESFILPRQSPGDDTRAVHYEYLLEGETCLNVVALDNMLEKSRKALLELRRMRAQSGLVKPMPEDDYRAECFNAVHLHQPGVAFENGFPMREWSNSWGYQRFLQDAKEGAVIDLAMFVVPEGYVETVETAE